MENEVDNTSHGALSEMEIPEEVEGLPLSKEGESDDGESYEEDTTDEKSIMSTHSTSMRSDNRAGPPPSILIPKDSEIKINNIPQPGTPYAVPSLRGRLQVSADKERYVCKGLWAMSDALHEIPGQTSDFELRLQKPSLTPESKLPISGRYSGWFILQQPHQKTPVKVEDKDINIRFEAKEDKTYHIQGEGHNKFGKFTVTGTLQSDGELQMYRSYVPKPLSTTNKSKKASSSKKSGGVTPRTPAASSMVSTPSAASGIAPVKPNSKHASKSAKQTQSGSSLPLTSPREGRSRRVSTVITEDNGTCRVDVPSNDSNLHESARAPSPVASLGPTAQSGKDGRSQRLSQHMLKCSEILKDLARQPQAMWFSEPVDYIKLNIPDYPTIIKDPMDFRTIRTNLDKAVYKSPEEFAEHVRLTFRNAITYNTSRDNLVHIAAREMSNRFEEKYRVLMSQFGTSAITTDYDSASRGNIGGGKKGKKTSGSTKRGSAGPKPLETETTVLPAAMDGNVLAVMDDLNRKIREMQSEITQLRSAVKQTDTKPEKNEKPEKSKKNTTLEPLTLEEKRALISRIHKLAPERMAKVVDIIQSALPPSDREDSDEVEIPLDELDTKTLRKLQDYVQNVPTIQSIAPKRKRQSSTGNSNITKTSSSTSKDSMKRAKSKDSSRVAPPAPLGNGKTKIESEGNINQSDGTEPEPGPGLFFSSTTITPAAEPQDQTHTQTQTPSLSAPSQEFKFHDPNTSTGMETDDDDIPDIYVPSSGDEEEIVTEDKSVSLTNISAWNSNMTITPNNIKDNNSNNDSSSHMNGMWSEAQSEKMAQLQRDTDRKNEEERLSKMKSKLELDRLLAQQSVLAQYEEERQQEENRIADQQTRSLEQQREEERLRRESTIQTVIVDQSPDVMMMLEDV
mmetsp:Transcript_35169/g.35812  ORF Transcript_35169/g.35812 Transcript_35169/m.35812 type:complete len:906 (-) Transcript_35169:213-2930(-)|eukprot:CAMPEP_0182420582 /NCGR_PEP_ID=MMETSP1167-20130531/5489_1 /TAXON_ID=2988 /ORGANISM="Mallomonas Sp, Strain CCMP3275" /LENGTH=905 /DNA_ID=CAMNT_0024596737 /DNA_START=120 /DNA_END=2837 /DNA_ORIENTATION=+